VPSSRSGYSSAAGLLPVQTYRTNAPTGTVVPVTDRVGGEVPSVADAGNANALVTTRLNTTTFAFTEGITGQAQSVAAVNPGNGNLSGIDFGFNFDTITHTNDIVGQGSLRQFIINSNALTNTGLSQVGQTTGKEVSIFMVSDGSAHAGLRAGLANQLTGGVAAISLATALPAITDSNTTIDGTTQTTLVGDSNGAVLGTGGSVGVDAVSLSVVNGPEVQLVPNASLWGNATYGLDLQGSNGIIRGMALYGFGKNLATNPTVFSGNIHVTGSNALIEQNVLGTTAKNFVAPVSNWSYGSGIVVENTSNGIVNNNLISFHDGTGVVLRRSNGFTVTNNELRGNDLHNYGTMDGISTVSSGGSHTIEGNLIVNNGACGIDNGRQDSLVIRNNTINGNGISTGAGLGVGNVETPGIRLGGSRANIFRNIIEANYGAGIMVRVASSGNENINPTQNTFSQNSIFQNGTIRNRGNMAATRQIGIDLQVSGQNTNQGTASYITPNIGVSPLDSILPNNGMDYPVMTSIKQHGQVLTIKGYIGNAGPDAAFGNSTIEFFIGDDTDTIQTSVQVISVAPFSSGKHWEGKTYLGGCAALNDGRFDCIINNPLVLGLTDVSALTVTATKTDGSTSEFGDRLPEIILDTLSGTVFLDDGRGSAINLANNGIHDGTEAGIINAEISLYDCVTNTLLGKSVTNGEGNYSINIPPDTPNGTEFCLVEKNAGEANRYLSTGASQTSIPLLITPGATGVAYNRTTDTMRFTYSLGNSYSTLNFGDVLPNQFITDGVKNGNPGNTLLYTHKFTAATNGKVKFSLNKTTTPNTPSWSEVLYTDTNCNGEIDSGENQTSSSDITIATGDSICLVLKQYIPANAAMGASNLVVVKADFTYTNANPVLTATYSRQDLTTVSNGALELKKRVRNVTTDGAGAPNWQVSNAAESGQILEYQITYTNQGDTDITTLSIEDATPAYTTFISATADITGINNLVDCKKITPASATAINCSAADTVGGQGEIRWQFDGVLAPHANGTVMFRVKLD
jgi:uncharacterized repeat protein (TIGR01451 family)